MLREDLLGLQRTAGNAAVVQLLRFSETDGHPVIQRRGGVVSTKSALDAPVSGQFRRMLSQGGRPKSRGLGTPTYRRVKAGLASYAAKQRLKPMAWRIKRVTKLEALVEGWLAKGKHLKDASAVGTAHRQAMQWLQPKLTAEFASLRGGRPRLRDEDSSESSEAEVSVRGVDTFRDEPDQFDWAKEDDDESVKETPIRTEDDEFDMSPSSDEDDDAVERADIEEPTDSKDADDDDDESSSSVSKTVSESKKDDDDESSSSSSSSVSKSVSESKKDDDDESSSSSSSESVSLPETKDEIIAYLSPTDEELAMSKSQRDDRIERRYYQLEGYANLNGFMQSPEVKDMHPSRAVAYSRTRSRDQEYSNEFTHWSPALKNLFDGYQNSLQAKKLEDTSDRAFKYLSEGNGWTKDIFDRYWHKVKQKYGPEDDEESSQIGNKGDEDSRTEADDDTKKKGEDGSKSDPNDSETQVDDSETQLDDSESKPEEKSDPDPITVTSVGPKERSRYQLHLGNPIKRGSSEDPYDTSEMVSSAAGKGWGIFVMTKNGAFYSGSHQVGIFHHSSFTSGSDVAGAGEMKIVNGKLTDMTNKSGHYKPSGQHSFQVMAALA
ncbi:MAG: hypothetical protein ACRDZ8_10330, partial [Acidimicrobiales bacterium]